MTQERLRSLSYEELVNFADAAHINMRGSLSKEQLITVIFEAINEERQDRENDNNLAVQLAAKKYLVGQDEELFVDFAHDINLPERYHENRLILILRDPSWMYCYWDIEDQTLEKIRKAPDYSRLILRITELSAPDWGRHSLLDWIDIPIRFEDLNRYINLRNEDSFYGGEIFAQFGDNEELILRSNIIETSRDYIVPSFKNYKSSKSKLIQLSGLSTDMGQFPGSGYAEKTIPQRIIKLASEGGV